MKTTVVLRDDVHQFLVNSFGKRSISKKINEILFEHLFKEKKHDKFGDMFGSAPWLKKVGWKDLRDHRDHVL